MGLNEQTESGKRWNYAPKKKWKDCYMSFGGIKEEADETGIDSVTNENYVAESPVPGIPNGTNDGSPDVPFLSTSLIHSPKHKSIASNYTNGHIADWSVVCRPKRDDVTDGRPKLQVLASASGPLASLRGALQAHSDQIAQTKVRTEEQAVAGGYAFKAADQGDRVSLVTGGPKARLASSFISNNSVIHMVNPVSADISTVKEDMNGKRIGIAHDAERDATLRSTPSREVHNKLEKNRRAHLKECFELLRRQLPSMEDKKISNQTILKAAFRYIQTLKRKERELEHELERLARAKIALQQNVSSLKKELQSKYDHMDFSAIIPDSTALEQMKDKDTKSTTTASEQPDLDDSDVIMSVPGSPYNQNGATTTSGLESEYDQPLNLSTAQPFANNRTSGWERVNANIQGSRHVITGGGSCSKSKPGTAKVESYFKNASSSRCLKVVSPGGVPLTKDCVGPPRATIAMDYINSPHTASVAAVTNGHVAQISLPQSAVTGATLTPVGGTTALTSVGALPTVVGSPVAHFSQIVKTATSISPLPQMAKVVTTWPANHALLTDSTALVNHPQSYASAPQLTMSSCVAAGKVTGIGGSTVARMSPAISTATTTVVPEGQSLPLMGAGGLHIPAQLVTGNVQLGPHSGGFLSQQAIQVFTTDGYKLISADGAINGSKPLAILAQSDGLEHLREDGKTTPLVMSVNKNGLPSFHLAVPAAVTRTISAPSQGTSLPISSLPLNLTVGGAAPLKVSQAGTTSLLPSYIPVANSNGLTRLLPGMSMVAPLVMSQPQRGVVIPTVSAASMDNVAKTHVSNPSGGVPLMSAQYANTLTAGLVNSVVVVSGAPAAVPTCSNPNGNKQ